jgi:hypothetical protein
MEINVPIETLRERKLFLAVPMYGGNCSGMFARSLADLSAKCTHYGISLQIYFLFNESLVQRARNYCCDEFIRSGATHMMFIDSDIGFDAQDVLMMLALQSDESEYDVLCGGYPKKTISWEKIKRAVEKGFAEDNPIDLDKYVGDYVFNPKHNQQEIPLNQPVEVLEGGTGFMMIRRKTFEVFDKHFPEQRYKPDHVRTEHFDGTREITAYFDCVIEPETKRYLSEDYMFCQYVQKVGLKVWLLPWIKLQHVGTFVFGGSLIDLAQIGASATADVSELKKK